jgi:protein involved in ribonucleotide reduction
MIDVIYFSNVTENTHKFVTKLELPSVMRIPLKGDFEYDVMNPYVLITPTYGTGKQEKEMVPHQVRKFLREKAFRTPCSGVIAGGSINFGEEYGLAGDVISRKLHVPLLYKFDTAGTTIDVERVRAGLERFCSLPNSSDLVSQSV